jgi:hypothetical protein
MPYIDKILADTFYTLYNRAFAPHFAASLPSDIFPYSFDIAYHQIFGYTRYGKSPFIPIDASIIYNNGPASNKKGAVGAPYSSVF